MSLDTKIGNNMNNVISKVNRKIVLVPRPNGAPTDSNLSLEQQPRPEPQVGEVLLATCIYPLTPI